MQIRLLGPVDAVGDDGSVRHSGSALRRTLLSLLALRPGQVLAPDWLLEHLWAKDQPDSGLRALRFHVSQLRKELGAIVPIETRPGGYCLDVSRTEVDALSFEDQARQARAEIDDAQAAGLCAAALVLWRGLPFGDAAECSMLDDEAARLEELRIAVVEHAHVRRLAAGAGVELIADLSQLVKEHPLREGLWSSLILAQYRAGQQAEALRTYERLRSNFAESLGLDPSPDLQNLQLRVLRQDPELLPVRAADGTGEEHLPPLPTGTVTFLLSDVEGSTQRWQEAPDAMAVAVPRHYQLLDEAIVAHGGVRPVEQVEGDSVVGAFAQASDAVAAAVEAQQAFALERWPEGGELRVRTALHTGETQLLDRNNYAGHTLNRTAQIRDSGHGGQILVSAATAQLVADRPPAEATLLDLGLHRLRDLERPEHIWQVVHPTLPSTFPPLRSLDVYHHNLPVQLTPLIGRTNEIADVETLLGGDRLVTLTGSGGVGKTRLALAVAADTVESHTGGVWWVELAPLFDPDAVGRAALAAIGAREASGATAIHQLAVELGDQPSLLVLDNCEHLIASCAELVTGVLTANPSTAVLATSREPLGVQGEITFRVPSLPCPSPQQPIDVTTLSDYDAVALFVERARRARPSFALSDDNAAAVTQICHRLDGIPLAIELAAARCRQLSAQHIATELDHRFRLLTGGARTVMGRQQTLAASIDWSHERLDDVEQATFRRLGVFDGPFPLEAAEATVAVSSDVRPSDVFDLISRLVDKSLVVADEGHSGEPRYRLLETLRAYALDRAAAAGELDTVRDAHAAWWAEWLEPRGDMPSDEILEEIEEFHANLKAALDWSVDRPELGLRLLGGVAYAWNDLGRAGDAMAAVDRLLVDANAELDPDEWLAVAWRTSHLVLEARGPANLTALLARIEAFAAGRGDELYRRLARWPTGEFPVGDPAWRQLAAERGDGYLNAWAPLMHALLLAEDEPVATAPVLEEARAAATASGMRSLRTMATLAEAELACSTGDLAVAIDIATDHLQHRSNPWWGAFVRIVSFAALLTEDEDVLRVAAEAAERGLRTSPGAGAWANKPRHRLGLLHNHQSVVNVSRDPPSPTCSTLWLVGRETIDAGAPDAAIDLARYWVQPQPHSCAVVASIEAAATGDEDRWHDALAIAVEQGLRLVAVDALEGLAVTAARVERWVECMQLLAAAQRLRDETSYRWRFSFEVRAVTTARTHAVTSLAEAAEAAEADGRQRNWREAAAYARRMQREGAAPPLHN